MKNFTWDNAFASGNSVIDDQHKHLLQLGSAFNSAILSTDNHYIAIGLVEELANYAIHHFKCEEEWLIAMGYPQIAVHHAQHEALKRDVVMRIMEIKRGGIPMNAELSLFLNDWISHHILEYDVGAIRWCLNNAPKY